MRKLGLATLVAAGCLSMPSASLGAVTSVLGGVPCTAQANGVRTCTGDTTHLATSFDGTPVDVNVVLPPEPASGPDGGFPIIGVYHGWGGSKLTPTQSFAGRTLTAWAQAGYAVFSMSDRGWGNTCGGTSTTRTSTGCVATGYNHLLDTRYEVRDAQTFLGLLADTRVSVGGPFLVDAQRIGATGQSYGGGLAMALAALKDRIMLPNGSYEPWVTPTTGRPLRIAASAPEIPWTDLAYSLVPSGRTLDYANGPDYGDAVGVMKQSFVSGLYAVGEASSNFAAPMSDPQADVRTWYSLLTGGEPYTDATKGILREVQAHHSSYFIDHSQPPAPLLIANGFTDDLFPVDEAVRFRNRTKAQWPDAFVGLMDLDYGHARGQNKAGDVSRLNARQRSFLEYYLGGTGGQPTEDAQVIRQVCDGQGATGQSGPVYSAPNWAKLAPGEVRAFAGAAQVVSSGGNAAASQAFDPIAGSGACATATDLDVPSTGVVRVPVTGSGFTLMGSTTVIADVVSASGNNQLAARLLDIGPDGNEILVARGLLRPQSTTGTLPVEEVFQLHPGAHTFVAGHTAKLELLSADTPYSRTSNGQTPITVSNISVRIPVNEAPDGTTIKAPAQKVLPEGSTLAPDFGGRADAPAAGPTGPAGPTGATGPGGSNGSAGGTGPAGSDGKDGATGPAGSNGKDGAIGPAGSNGKDGATGPAGSNGRDGATGPAGPGGANGKDGRDGATGPGGKDGAPGPAGPAGPGGAATPAGASVAVDKTQRATARTKGVRVRLRCPAACTAAMQLRLDAKTTKALGLSSAVVGSSTRKLAAAGRATQQVKLTASLAQRVLAARSSRLTLRATVTTAAGTQTFSRAVTLAGR